VLRPRHSGRTRGSVSTGNKVVDVRARTGQQVQHLPTSINSSIAGDDSAAGGLCYSVILRPRTPAGCAVGTLTPAVSQRRHPRSRGCFNGALTVCPLSVGGLRIGNGLWDLTTITTRWRQTRTAGPKRLYIAHVVISSSLFHQSVA